MPYLHYGSELRVELDPTGSKRAIEAIGAHATRGGWVTITDAENRTFSLLITAGIAIWVGDDE